MYEGNSAYSGIDEFAIFEAVSRPKRNPPAPAGMVERLISTDVNELVLQKKENCLSLDVAKISDLQFQFFEKAEVIGDIIECDEPKLISEENDWNINPRQQRYPPFRNYYLI